MGFRKAEGSKDTAEQRTLVWITKENLVTEYQVVV